MHECCACLATNLVVDKLGKPTLADNSATNAGMVAHGLATPPNVFLPKPPFYSRLFRPYTNHSRRMATVPFLPTTIPAARFASRKADSVDNP